MTKFFVFSYAQKEIRKATRLVGWRDGHTFNTEKEARDRRDALKKDQDARVLRRVIRSEEWS